MASGNYLAVREGWLALRQETVIDPELRIVDAHHHFYDRPGWTYLADDYLADARSGHRVVAAVHMQAQTRYRADGTEALRPVGETEAVIAMTQASSTEGPMLAKGIVGHANLRLGAAVSEVLEAHIHAGQGRFKGVIYAELGCPAPLARGLFCLSRSVGILAHAWEQTEQGGRIKGPIPRQYIPTYDGPKQRAVSTAG